MKKNGFTLAEVLITLAIIGIVAALTVPTLMTDSRYQLVSSRVSKFVSVTEDAALAQAAMNGTIDRASLNDIILFKSHKTVDGNEQYELKDGTRLVISDAASGYLDSPYNDTTKYGDSFAHLEFFHNVSGINNVHPSLNFIMTNKGYIFPDQRDVCTADMFDKENEGKTPWKLTKTLADGNCKNTATH